MTPKRSPSDVLAAYDACKYVSEKELAESLREEIASYKALLNTLSCIESLSSDLGNMLRTPLIERLNEILTVLRGKE